MSISQCRIPGMAREAWDGDKVGGSSCSDQLSVSEKDGDGPSTSKRPREDLLEDAEAIELVEFDPKVDPKGT